MYFAASREKLCFTLAVPGALQGAARTSDAPGIDGLWSLRVLRFARGRLRVPSQAPAAVDACAWCAPVRTLRSIRCGGDPAASREKLRFTLAVPGALQGAARTSVPPGTDGLRGTMLASGPAAPNCQPSPLYRSPVALSISAWRKGVCGPLLPRSPSPSSRCAALAVVGPRKRMLNRR